MGLNGRNIPTQPEILECFFALIPDLAAIISSDNCFRRVNPAWRRTLGYSTEELLDAPIAHFVHPDDLESTLKKLAEEFAGTGFVNRYLCKNGSSKWIQWEAALARDKSVVLAAGRDITEQKCAEQKAEDRDRQLSDNIQQRFRRAFPVVGGGAGPVSLCYRQSKVPAVDGSRGVRGIGKMPS